MKQNLKKTLLFINDKLSLSFAQKTFVYEKEAFLSIENSLKQKKKKHFTCGRDECKDNFPEECEEVHNVIHTTGSWWVIVGIWWLTITVVVACWKRKTLENLSEKL